MDQLEKVNAAVASVRSRSNQICPTAIILGSGLGGLADGISGTKIPYAEVDGFPVSTAPEHKGCLIVGELEGASVALMQGRFHLYEGWSAGDIALAVRTLKALGAERLIITNAAGALDPDYRPGEVMLIVDHLNFTGHNPLTGQNDERVGPRFPDLSRAYDPALLELASKLAKESGISVRKGVYAGVAGPSLETSAERRFFRLAGADAVGMSTVIEAIAAAHIGLPVLGMSAVTNMATGGPEQQPDTIEQVLANAALAGRDIERLIRALVPAFS